MNLDITYCIGGDCVLRFDCLRHTAEYYGRFDMFGSAPYDHETESCELFMSNAQQVNTTAYFLWQEAGCPSDADMYFWLEAKKKIADSVS